MRTILAGIAVLCAAPAAAEVSPRLAARPSASVAAELPTGITKLAHGAIAYRPVDAPARPLPVLVLLHGAGGGADELVRTLQPEADRRGLLLVGLKSKALTWDLIENARRASGGRSSGRLDVRYGADVARIDEVLAELFRRTAVDPRRVAVGGFSDGASYALSLGLANPELFSAIVALSPGFLAPPDRFDSRQKVFISHGRKDEILAFSNADRIATVLGSTGVKVRFRPFDGTHQLSRSAVLEGLDFALGR